MRYLKKLLSLALGIILTMGISLHAYASETIAYTPIETTESEIIDLSALNLVTGEKITIGAYTIEYEENFIQTISNTRATTTSHENVSHYKIYNNGDEQEWYKITQTTNYTYDGSTVKINTSACKLNISKYYTDGSYTINTNSVNNSSNTAPTYTIGVTMNFPQSTLTIKDVVTVYADGSHNVTHYQ